MVVIKEGITTVRLCCAYDVDQTHGLTSLGKNW